MRIGKKSRSCYTGTAKGGSKSMVCLRLFTQEDLGRLDVFGRSLLSDLDEFLEALLLTFLKNNTG